MLYTLKQPSKNKMYSVKITGTGFQFHFKVMDVHYYEDGSLLPNQDLEFTPYIPTLEEQTALREEYVNWCTKFEQEQDETLMGILSNPDYWKEYKSKQLTEISDAFEDNLNRDMYFISSLGFKANGDRRTANNIANLINMFDIASGEKGTVSYRDYDNVDHELNKEQLATLLAEHIGNGNALYSQKWTKKEAIKNASTLDDLAAISLDFEMKDYTQESIQQTLQSSNQKRDEDHKTSLSKILKL